MNVIKKKWMHILFIITFISIAFFVCNQSVAWADDDGIGEPDVTHYDSSETTGLSSGEIDLFYIAEFGSPSKLDSNNQTLILQHIAEVKNPESLGGLGFEVHRITFGQANQAAGDDYRRISPDSDDTAYAIYLIEDSISPLRVDGIKQDLGSVPTHGTPKMVDWGKIYTKRIEDLLKEECNNKPIDEITTEDCLENSSPPQTGRNLYNRFVFHVYTHEAGHMLGPLAHDLPPYYHTDDKKNPTAMDQAVVYKYSKKDKNTLFTIVNQFREEDQLNPTTVP